MKLGFTAAKEIGVVAAAACVTGLHEGRKTEDSNICRNIKKQLCKTEKPLTSFPLPEGKNVYCSLSCLAAPRAAASAAVPVGMVPARWQCPALGGTLSGTVCGDRGVVWTWQKQASLSPPPHLLRSPSAHPSVPQK